MQKQKKVIGYVILVILVFWLSGIKIHAEPIKKVEIGNETKKEKTISQEDIFKYGMELIDWSSIQALEEDLSSAMPNGKAFDLKNEMQKIISGQVRLSLSGSIGFILKALFNEIGVFIQIGARFVLIVLLCNLLQTLSSSFKSKEITKIAFFVCYMTILLGVTQSFKVMIELANTLIDQISRIMMVCIPILLAFMATSGLSLSAGAMAPVIVSTLSMMTYLMKIFLLPCIISVVVLEMMNAMSQEIKVDKWIGLFYKGIKWGLVSLLSMSMGILSLYRLTLPGVDHTIKKASLKLSSVFLPVVGKSINETIEFVAQCSTVIKNTFAAGVLIFILVLVCIPMIKILAYVLVYEIAAAVIEPIGDKKMASIASKLSKGCKCIMSCVGVMVLFCIVALMICMTIAASGV